MTDHPFGSVLVPLDGSTLSEQALPFAMAIAGKGGSVTLLQAVPDAEPLRKPFGAITMSAEEVLEMLTNLAEADLDRAEEHWADVAPDVTISKKAISGDAATVILDTAEEQNIDLIALASTGRGALGRLTLGSVADRVVRTADRPVLVVRGYEHRPRASCLSCSGSSCRWTARTARCWPYRPQRRSRSSCGRRWSC